MSRRVHRRATLKPEKVFALIRKSNYKELATYLINGGDPNISNSSYSALFVAVYFGNLDIIKLLIQYKASLHATTKTQIEIPGEFERLQGEKIELKDVKMHICGKKDCCGRTFLTEEKFDGAINPGSTPLFLSILSKNPQALGLLLDAKANVNAKDSQGGATPLIYTIAYNKPNMAKQLIEHKASIGDIEGQPALAWAVEYKNYPVTKILIEAKADINEKIGEFGKTALHIACVLNNPPLIELMAANGGDFFVENINGNMPIQINRKTILSVLHKLGFKINILPVFEDKGGELIVDVGDSSTNLEQKILSIFYLHGKSFVIHPEKNKPPIFEVHRHPQDKLELDSEEDTFSPTEGYIEEKTLPELFDFTILHYKNIFKLEKQLNQLGKIKLDIERIKAYCPISLEIIKKLNKLDKFLNLNLNFFNVFFAQYALDFRKILNKEDILNAWKNLTSQQFLLACSIFEQKLVSYGAVIATIQHLFVEIEKDIAQILHENQAGDRKKLEEEFKKNQAINKLKMAPIICWHLTQHLAHCSRLFTSQYKYFWKMSEKYSRSRFQQLEPYILPGDWLNQFDFANLEATTQRLDKDYHQLGQVLEIAIKTDWPAGEEKINKSIETIESTIERITKLNLELHSLQGKFEKQIRTLPVKRLPPADDQVIEDSKKMRSTRLRRNKPLATPQVKNKKWSVSLLDSSDSPFIDVDAKQYEYKQTPLSDLSAIIICVEEATLLNNSLNTINLFLAGKNIVEAQLGALAVLAMMVRINAFLHSNLTANLTSRVLSGDILEKINVIRNQVFSVLSEAVTLECTLSTKKVGYLGSYMQEFLSGLVSLIGGKNKKSLKEFKKPWDNFKIAAEGLLAEINDEKPKDQRNSCFQTLKMILKSLSKGPKPAEMEIYLNALLFVGGLVDKLKVSDRCDRSVHETLAQARHSAFPDYTRILGASMSLVDSPSIFKESKRSEPLDMLVEARAVNGEGLRNFRLDPLSVKIYGSF